MDDDQTLSPLLDRIEGLEAMLLRLAGRVDELSVRRSPPGGTSPDVDTERRFPGPRTPEELEELAQWVDRLQERYAATGDWLRPCWWRHGLVVEELAALRTAWLGAYHDEGTIAPSAALDWHEAAERCRERVRHAINTGPGCSYVRHRPDESITEDPRWVEEREALRQGRAGFGGDRLRRGNREDRELGHVGRGPDQTTVVPIQ